MAAFAGAGTVVAAAGPMRALFVVLADMLAFAFVAMTAVRAVVIDAAFGANARPIVDVVATDQPVAAVELRAVIGWSHTARLPFAPAAVALRRADTGIADFAIAAVAVFAAFRAEAGFSGDAAFQPNAAVQLRTGAGLRFRNAEVSALAERHALPIAAFLALVAFAIADAIGAEAELAVVVVATFGAIAALTTGAAEEIVAAVALGAGAVSDGAGFARVAAAGSIGHAFVLAAFLTFGAGADTRAKCANFAVARAIGIRAAFATPTPAGSLAAGQPATTRHP